MNDVSQNDYSNVVISFSTPLDNGQDPGTWGTTFTRSGVPTPPDSIGGGGTDWTFTAAPWANEPPDAWSIANPGNVIADDASTLAAPFSGSVSPLPDAGVMQLIGTAADTLEVITTVSQDAGQDPDTWGLEFTTLGVSNPPDSHAFTGGRWTFTAAAWTLLFPDAYEFTTPNAVRFTPPSRLVANLSGPVVGPA